MTQNHWCGSCGADTQDDGPCPFCAKARQTCPDCKNTWDKRYNDHCAWCAANKGK